MTDFIRSLPAPRQVLPKAPQLASLVETGHQLFREIGCADCHSESLGPIQGLYSDMLLHDLGVELESITGSYGSSIPEPTVRNDKFEVAEQPVPGEWRTAPLWGVADSAPYLHDGRAGTLKEAILAHGGEASDVTARFQGRPEKDQEALVAFLQTLLAPAEEKLAAR
jgi:CxxC motif-containing protein (DUF1111 family)